MFVLLVFFSRKKLITLNNIKTEAAKNVLKYYTLYIWSENICGSEFRNISRRDNNRIEAFEP